VSEGT